MKAMDLYELLNNAGVQFEVVEIMDGSRHIQVMVEEEDEGGDQLLSDATDEWIIEFARRMGYTLTPDDCVELRKNPLPDFNGDETVSEAVNDFLNTYER
jgi:hypothetical protein